MLILFLMTPTPLPYTLALKVVRAIVNIARILQAYPALLLTSPWTGALGLTQPWRTPTHAKVFARGGRCTICKVHLTNTLTTECLQCASAVDWSFWVPLLPVLKMMFPLCAGMARAVSGTLDAVDEAAPMESFSTAAFATHEPYALPSEHIFRWAFCCLCLGMAPLKMVTLQDSLVVGSLEVPAAAAQELSQPLRHGCRGLTACACSSVFSPLYECLQLRR